MSEPSWLEQARSKWTNRGAARPPFAVEPGPGQESVWDYPRPPAIVADPRPVVVRTAEVVSADTAIAETTTSVRVLETASPPTFYLPATDVALDRLEPAAGSSFCEWKGPAQYWGLADDPVGDPIGWSYPTPLAGFEVIAGYVAFYPGRVHCEVAGEVVRPQGGGFYGGWITDEIVGPFKGDPGTGAW